MCNSSVPTPSLPFLEFSLATSVPDQMPLQLPYDNAGQYRREDTCVRDLVLILEAIAASSLSCLHGRQYSNIDLESSPEIVARALLDGCLWLSLALDVLMQGHAR